jgi:anti-anti-sigma factor
VLGKVPIRVQRLRDYPTWGYTVSGDDPVVLAVRGEIDLATAPELAGTLGELVQDGHHHVVLDLSATEYLDSSGLHVLAKARHRLREAGGYLALSAVSPPVASVLERTGVDRLLPLSRR